MPRLRISYTPVPWASQSNGLLILASAKGPKSTEAELTVSIAFIDDGYLDWDAVCGGFGFGVIREAGDAGIGEIYETQGCCETTI